MKPGGKLVEKLQLEAFAAFYEGAVTKQGDGIDARMKAFARAIALSCDDRVAEAMKNRGPLIEKYNKLKRKNNATKR